MIANVDLFSTEACRPPAPPLGRRPSATDLLYRGVRAQEDRDTRAAARVAGVAQPGWHMIRIRLPLGALTPDQYLALDCLSERVTYNHSLRATAGQSLQLHGVAPADLEGALATIRGAGLAAGCNPDGLEYAVVAPPAPFAQPGYLRLRALARELCDGLYPTPWDEAAHPDHPPRKFTIGLGLVADNSTNVFAQDVGLVLVERPGAAPRVNVLVGGGLSMPGRRPGSYARVATPLGSVSGDEVLPTVRGLSALFRQLGQIERRRFTRFKYVVEALGVEALRAAVEARLGWRLGPWIAVGPYGARAWLGRHAQGDGRVFCGIKVPNGRIMDVGQRRYKAALRAAVEAYRPTLIITPGQDVILGGLRPHDADGVEAVLAAYHVPFGAGLPPVRAAAMACAGLPTCPLALAESERVTERLLPELERALARVGRAGAPFVVRISGCGLGCIRPNMVDLGLVGRKPGRYDLFVGGEESSGRLGELYAESVPVEEVLPTVEPLLTYWGCWAAPGESFSAFYQRRFGPATLPTRLESVNGPPARPRLEAALRAAHRGAEPAKGGRRPETEPIPQNNLL